MDDGGLKERRFFSTAALPQSGGCKAPQTRTSMTATATRTAPSTTSTRVSRVTRTVSLRSSAPPQIPEGKVVSSSRSSVSAARRRQTRSPNATPVPLMSTVNKRLSSGIPKAASRVEGTRRQSSIPFVTHANGSGEPANTSTPPPALARTRPQATPPSISGSVRSRAMSHNYVSDQSEKYGSNMISTPARLNPKPPQKTPPPNAVAKSPRPKSVVASPKNVTNSPRSVQQKTTPSKQHTRQQASTSTISGLPGVPWSPQGKLNAKSSSLLEDSPASLDKKFNAFSPQMSFNGEMSVWDGDDMSFDMVTEDGDGAVDEDVRSLLF